MLNLKIIGTGLKGLGDMSLNAFKALRDSRKILLLAPLDEELQKNGFDSYENIFHLYKDGDVDLNNYKRIVDKINQDLNIYMDVAFVLQGHPRFGVTLNSLIEKNFDKNIIKVEYFAGISSFDAMINDLEIDPLERGTQIYDANRLILFEYKINIYADLFLYHISAVANSRTNYLNPEATNHILFLQEYLLRFYSEDKAVCIISSQQNNSFGNIESIKVKELQKSINKLTYTCSLFIGAEKTNQINSHFLNIIKNVE